MIIKEIQKQVDTFRDLIAKSRITITEGHFVDISQLDSNVNFLFEKIKSQYGNLSNTEIDSLRISVETLLSDFDNLAKALDNQFSSLTKETKVWPNTAIAAYQN